MKINEELFKAKSFMFQNRFKGYCLSPRSRYLLYINKNLLASEYILFSLIYDSLADWDKRHALYGTFEFNVNLNHEWLKWSVSKTRRNFDSLIKKGFITDLGSNRYAVTGFGLKEYISEKGFDFYSEVLNQISTSEKSIISNENNYVENNKK